MTRKWNTVVVAAWMAASGLAGRAGAQVTATWASATGTWSHSANWMGGLVPAEAVDTAVLGGTGPQYIWPTLDVPIKLSELRFVAPAPGAPQSIWLRSGGGSIELGAAGPSRISIDRAVGSMSSGVPMHLSDRLDVVVTPGARSGLPDLTLEGALSGPGAINTALMPGTFSLTLRLMGNNAAWDGPLNVAPGTTVLVSTASGLGSTAGSTTVAAGGTLGASGALAETIYNNGGTVTLGNSVAPRTGLVVLANSGTLISVSDHVTPVQLSGGRPTILAQPLGTSPTVASNRVPTVGHGDLTLGIQSLSSVPVLSLHRSLLHSGSTKTTSSLQIDSPLEVAGSLSAPAVTLNRDLTVGALFLDSSLTASGSATLRGQVPGATRVQIGSPTGRATRVDAAFDAGIGTLEVHGIYTDLIRLNGFQGTLELHALTSFINEANTQPMQGARVRMAGDPDFMACTMSSTLNIPWDFWLNNASGEGQAGVLRGGRLSGRIDVGDIGSTVGGTMTISGQITGAGALRLVQNLPHSAEEVVVRSDGHTLSGSVYVDGTHLRLVDNGRLTTPSAIIVSGALDRPAVFTLDEGGSARLSDRIGDQTDIVLRSAEFNQRGGTTAPRSTEVMGVLRLERGYCNLQEVLRPPDLLAIRLQRDRGAVARVIVPLDAMTSARWVRFVDPPVLNDGVVTGLSALDLITYDSTIGLMRLQQYWPELTTATPTANVRPVDYNTSVVLDADVTINAAHMRQATVDLGGRVLTVDTGMFLNAASITNGVLRPGEGSTELFVESSNVGARITDGPAGPTHLVTSQSVTLSGQNTYTGHTYANGYLRIASLDALPETTVLEVSRGNVSFTLPSGVDPVTVHVREVALRDYGRLSSGGTTRPLTLEAARFVFETGVVDCPLSGTGELIKHSSGSVLFTRASPNFSGPVTVAGGIIEAAGGTQSFGTGPVRVLPGGMIRANNSIANPVELAGGIAERLQASGAVSITADSKAGTLSVFGPLRVAPGARLMVNVADIRGDVQLDGEVVRRPELVSSGWTYWIGSIPGSRLSGAGRTDLLAGLNDGVRLAPGEGAGTGKIGAIEFGVLSVGSGGILEIELARAVGVPGIDWDLVRTTKPLTTVPDLVWTIRISDLMLGGPIDWFDVDRSYHWQVVAAAGTTARALTGVQFDLSGFSPALPPGARFTAALRNDGLWVSYVPEPTLAALLTVLGVACASRRRRRHGLNPNSPNYPFLL